MRVQVKSRGGASLVSSVVRIGFQPPSSLLLVHSEGAISYESELQPLVAPVRTRLQATKESFETVRKMTHINSLA